MTKRLVYFNGLLPESGAYIAPPVGLDKLAARIKQADVRPSASWRGEPIPDVDPLDLGTAGWGVLFAHDADERVRQALRPLLRLRREQAADKNPRFYREFWGAQGYRPGESRSRWLARTGIAPGPADPARVPYYLMLVGGPQSIPFRFQQDLSLQYAVGRIAFDSPEEYASYAATVVSAEESAPLPRPRAVVFGVRNPDDPATEYALEELMMPAHARLSESELDWQVDDYFGPRATKSTLRRILTDEVPALLFTGSHGLGLPADVSDHPGALGSLVCSDWKGPESGEVLGPEHYYAAGDVAASADLRGLVVFSFACFSLGVPRHDSYATDGAPRLLTERPFLAPLPKRLLGHANGGAAAVIGHVDRAKGYSFFWPGAGRQWGAIYSTLRRLMQGYPVGTAARYLSERSADIALELHRYRSGGEPIEDEELVALYSGFVDSRSYAVLGDPAVRIARSLA